MDFIELHPRLFVCDDQCDVTAEDITVGVIGKDDDGYWRFVPGDHRMTCSQLKQLSIKLSELNIQG
jgi:hypothetical protein